MLAALFDLDGLLVDSEPFWRRSEIEIFGSVGVHLTDAECAETTGLRIDEVVALRHRQTPWASPGVDVVTAHIVERMIALVSTEAVAMPGAHAAIDRCAAAGLRMLVVSSSPTRLIEAALTRLGVRDRFERVVSAEHERYGKPHPAVLLRAAESIEVSPLDCLVLEDSLNGVLAAKAARMTCVAVPEPAHARDPRFAIADLVLPSLEAFDEGALARLVASSRA